MAIYHPGSPRHWFWYRLPTLVPRQSPPTTPRPTDPPVTRVPFPNHSPAYVNLPRDDDNDDADEYTESDAIPLVPEVFPQENTNNEATFGGNNNNNNVVTGGNNNRPTLSDGVWWWR